MRPPPTHKFSPFGKPLFTNRHSMRTARVETASSRRGDQAGDFSSRRQRLLALSDSSETLWVWCGREKQLGIGMFWLLDKLIAWSSLNHLARVHYHCVLGEV